MSDVQSVPVPGQGDQGQPQGQAPSVPSGVPAAGATEPASQTEQGTVLTRAEAEAMVKAAVDEAENRMRSYADKGRVRAERAAQEAKDMVKKMRDLGQDISEAEADKIVQAAKMKAIEAPDADEPVTQGGQPAQAVDLEYWHQNELGQHVLKMQGKYGVRELEPSDPELQNFKLTGDRKQDEANLETMYKALSERLSANGPAPNGGGETNKSTIETGASVRVPSQGGASPSFVAKEASEYWRRAHKG